MQCVLKRVIVTYENKDKETVKGSNFFIEFQNGEKIYIKPVYDKTSTDFIRLRAFSDLSSEN